MKLFLDTNIFIEYFENRLQSNLVGQVFDTIEEGVVEAVTSTGGFYTMTYLLTNALKRNNIHKPEQTKRLRTILNGVLKLITVVDVAHENIYDAVNDESFTDLEDSYQYRCALQNSCTQLITINIRDYTHVESNNIEILTPEQFIEKYL